MLNSDFTQESNIGGVMRLVIISDDSFLNSVIDGQWNSIDIIEGAAATEVIFAPNSCNFTYTSKTSEFGPFFQHQISCSKPKLTKQINEFFALNSERQWVAFVQDFNFLTHVVGVPNGGLILVNTASTGGSINNNALSFVGDTVSPPFITDSFDMNTFAYTPTNPFNHENFVIKEIPDGDIDGVNTIFTLANLPILGSEYVFLNGLLLESGSDYNIAGNIITMAFAIGIGEKLRVSYSK